MDNVYDLLMRGESIGDAPPEPEDEKLGRKALGRKSPGDGGVRPFCILNPSLLFD